jgi:hypothetical protein
MATEQKTEKVGEGGVVRRTTIEEFSAGGKPQPVKAYKLRQGARHTQDGQAVKSGDEVMLTKSQAQAFRDKFEAVDDSEFEEPKEIPRYKASSEDQKDKSEPDTDDERDDAEKEAAQGDPVPQPPAVVRPIAAGTRDPNLPPVDPTALDPAKQGQPSREQRRTIDSGNAPMPKSVTEPPKEEEKNRAAGSTGSTGGTTGGAARARQTGGGRQRDNPLGDSSRPKEGSSKDLD